MKRFAEYLDNRIYYMLLFTVAVIPLQQEFTAFCVGVTLLAAALVAYYKGRHQPCVLKNWQQGLLYLLLLIGVVSLQFSLNKFISSWNYLYVAGQYSALFFVLLRYGWQCPQVYGNTTGAAPGSAELGAKSMIADAEAGAPTSMQGACKSCDHCLRLPFLWQSFSSLPRPLQLIGAY